MNTRGVELVNVAPYIRDDKKLEELADKAKVSKDNAGRVISELVNEKNGHKRQPRTLPPKQGISQSEARRKYNVPQTTISGWVAKGYIPILLRTNKEVYIDEDRLREIVEVYKSAPGQGKKTVKRQFAP